MPQRRSVAVIGTNDLGVSIAHCLMKWPGGLTVYDANGSGYGALAGDGITVAATLTEALEADIVSIVDLKASGVDDLFCDLGRHLRPGTILAVHATVSESTITEAAHDLLRWGVHLVDAPVSGSPTAALMGELAVMIGATPEVFTILETPFSQWASLVVHAGATGMGCRMKLAESLWTFTRLEAAQEVQRLAMAGGVDGDALADLMGLDTALDAFTTAAAAAAEARSLLPDAESGLGLGAQASIDMPITEQATNSVRDGDDPASASPPEAAGPEDA